MKDKEVEKQKINESMKSTNAVKAKDLKGSWLKLLSYVSDYKVSIIIVILFTIIGAIITTISPKISGEALTLLSEGANSLVVGNGKGINLDEVFSILSKLFILYSISALASCINSYIMTGIAVKITYKLRQEISKKISKLSLRYFDVTPYGEILSKITNDVDLLSSTLTESISTVVSSLVMLFGTLYMMFTISWEMTLVSFAILPISAIFISFIVKKSRKYFKQYQDHLGHINGHIEEMYSGHNIIKVFNGEEKSINKFNEYNDVMYNSSWKSQFLSGLMSPIMGLVSNLVYISVCIMGGYLAVKRNLAIGDISAFMVYIGQFTGPLMQVANISNILQSTAVAAERVFDFLNEEEEKKDSKDIIEIGDCVDELTRKNTISIKGNIVFKDVSFGYNPNSTVINNLNLEIKQGQTVAIVGPTGSGKTTLIKLLMRFYDIDSGEIIVDGYNINRFKKDDFRQNFGVVLQDTWLYNGTIMDNIRYGNLLASDIEVEETAKMVQVDHFIKTLTNQYNTVLNESTDNISQGQKQLISIARTILHNPKILILDEATSSIDTRTEVLIQEAINKVLKDRTSIVIAHRLSTIRNADLIIVMDKGMIAERGTHKELIDKKGLYFELYNSQFGYCN